MIRRLRWSWLFGRLRPVKCWLRLGHVWTRHEWTDKHGDLVVEEQCGRCLIERHMFALWALWGGIPVVWRVSFRAKHGKWPKSTYHVSGSELPDPAPVSLSVQEGQGEA